MTTIWTMRVVEGDIPPRDVAAEDGLVIGRHADCGLTLNDHHVSKRHAKIVMNGARLAIVDLGSNNGTIINGDRVLREGQECALKDGLRIQLGYSEIAIVGPKDNDETVHAGSAPAMHELTVASVEDWNTIQTDPVELEETVGAQPAAQFPPPAAPPVAPPVPPPAPPQALPQTPVAPQTLQQPPSPQSAPVRHASDSHLDDFDSPDMQTIIGEVGHVVGSEARLQSMEARLVIVNEADMRIVPLDQQEFTIGRSKDSHLRLDNRGVSQSHGLIRFHPKSNTFTLEDVGSANGTLLANAPLSPQSPREIDPDTHLRFGTIEAVFMQGLDSEFHQLTADRHDDAAKLLRSRGKLSAQAIKLATKNAQEQGTSIGEALLLGQHVKPRDWCLAVKDARLAANLAVLSGSRSKAPLVLSLLLVAAVLVALAIWFDVPMGSSPEEAPTGSTEGNTGDNVEPPSTDR